MLFVHFGCWNNMNGSLKENMEFIRDSTEGQKIKLLSVAGDNYYPEKEEKEEKEKEKGEEEKEKKEEKVSLFDDVYKCPHARNSSRM